MALKRLPANLSEDEEFQRRFRREAHAAARLNSPHVIPIHHYGEVDGRLYVDMRLVEGRDLHTVLDDGPLEPVRAVHIIGQVAEALHAAHDVVCCTDPDQRYATTVELADAAAMPSPFPSSSRQRNRRGCELHPIDFGIARVLEDTRMTKTRNTSSSTPMSSNRSGVKQAWSSFRRRCGGIKA